MINGHCVARVVKHSFSFGEICDRLDARLVYQLVPGRTYRNKFHACVFVTNDINFTISKCGDTDVLQGDLKYLKSIVMSF